MKIIFLQDYTGRETAMQEKKEGDSMECGTAIGLALIDLGMAQEAVFDVLPEIEKVTRRRKIREEG